MDWFGSPPPPPCVALDHHEPLELECAPPPLVIAPTSGPAAGGFQVQIRGLSGTLVSATFAGRAAEITSATRTGDAVVVAPAYVPGVVDLVLVVHKKSSRVRRQRPPHPPTTTTTTTTKFVYTQATWREFVTKVPPVPPAATDPYNLLEFNPLTNRIVRSFAPPGGIGLRACGVTPDGKTLIVGAFVGPGRMFHYSLITNTLVADFVVTTSQPPAFDRVLAFTMDPKGAWYVVSDGLNPQIVVLSVAQPGVVLAELRFGLANSLATTPDGRFVLALVQNDALFVVDTETWQVTAQAAAPNATSGLGIAPDGQRAYVTTNVGQVDVFDIATATFLPSQAIPTPGYPFSFEYFVLTPDGKWGYTPVDSFLQTRIGIISFPEGGTPRFVGAIPLRFPLGGAAATPDSRTVTVLAGSGLTPQNVNQLLVATQTFVSQRAVVGLQPQQVCITADPAPLAQFTTRRLSARTYELDASGSIAPIGAISTYEWDFGDGSPSVVVNGNPVITHTFAGSKKKSTVTLVVTTTGGTSTEQVWSSVLMSNNGGPTARAVKRVTLETAETTQRRQRRRLRCRRRAR